MWERSALVVWIKSFRTMCECPFRSRQNFTSTCHCMNNDIGDIMIIGTSNHIPSISLGLADPPPTFFYVIYSDDARIRGKKRKERFEKKMYIFKY